MQIQHTNVIDAGSVRKIKRNLPKTIISNWTGDVRSFVPRSYKTIGRHADVNLISSTGQLPLFKKEIGPNVKYWQIGYNPRLYFPEEKPRHKYEWDICFIGNNNPKEKYPGRVERELACKLLRKKFGNRFALFGNGWPKSLKSRGSIDQKTVINAYHKSFAVLSVSHFNDINHYFSDRLLMCMASGRPTIQFHFPKYESYFTNNCDLVIANNVQDIGDKMDWLLANPKMANYIGQSGAAKVAAEHTYLSRVNELFELVGLR
jgi:spore maturation protein CgeB